MLSSVSMSVAMIPRVLTVTGPPLAPRIPLRARPVTVGGCPSISLAELDKLDKLETEEPMSSALETLLLEPESENSLPQLESVWSMAAVVAGAHVLLGMLAAVVKILVMLRVLFVGPLVEVPGCLVVAVAVVVVVMEVEGPLPALSIHLVII